MNNVSALEINSVRQFMIGVSKTGARASSRRRALTHQLPMSLVAQQILPTGQTQRRERRCVCACVDGCDPSPNAPLSLCDSGLMDSFGLSVQQHEPQARNSRSRRARSSLRLQVRRPTFSACIALVTYDTCTCSCRVRLFLRIVCLLPWLVWKSLTALCLPVSLSLASGSSAAPQRLRRFRG